MPSLDTVTLHFDPSSLVLLNVILAAVMFGVALDLTPRDFTRLARMPHALAIELVAQFVLMPAASFLLVLLLAPQASVALGMILVAACPGGNVSNFIAQRANGNVALSVTLSAVTTVLSIVMTPLNLAFYGGLYAPTADLLKAVAVDPFDVAVAVAFLVVVPLGLGMLVNVRAPAFAARLRGPMRVASLAVLAFFIAGALAANWGYFVAFVGGVFIAVLLQNGLGLLGGYVLAQAASLPEADRRSIAIEAGMQNTGFGLVLIFNFFNGLGGMAIIAAWWGVWHIVSGLVFSEIVRRRDMRVATVDA